MPDLRLFHYPPSYYSQIARLALAEAGLSYDGVRVDIGPRMENYDPWYARIHPEMVVPALQCDGEVVTETTRILRFIDTELEEAELTPNRLSSEEVDEWCDRIDEFPVREFAYGTGPPSFLTKRVFTLRRRTIQNHLEDNPELREEYETRLEDIDEWESVSLDEEEMAELEDRVDELLDQIEGTLDRNRWLAGESYSRADVFLTVLLARLDFLGRSSSRHESERPNVADFYERVRSRPTFDRADIWRSFQPLRLFGLQIRSVVSRLWRAVTGPPERPQLTA